MNPSKVARNDEHLTDHYTPCNAVSVFHDLTCGHRIKVEFPWEMCAPNCKVPMLGKPFVCFPCLVRDVRLEMIFESLDLNATGEDVVMEDGNMSRKERIQEIANLELQKLLVRGHRKCIIAPKLNDPILQFFDQFLVEDGFAGINEERPHTPGVRYRRPHQRAANDMEQDDFTEEGFKVEWERQERLEQGQSGQGRRSVGSDEDEAADAVRDALIACRAADSFF